MELSRRLQAVADLVTPGYRIVDIGTDHAYIPIYLTEKHIVPKALAVDINPGPLKRAEEHIRQSNVEEKITLRLSDGLGKVKPDEAECAVLAGMGGALMIKILEEGEMIVRRLKECVLQPQSEIAKVRTFLLEKGFLFQTEDMVEEEGKFYPMMKVIPGKGRQSSSVWNPVEIQYGRLLLGQKNPVLYRFLDREIQEKCAILRQLKEINTARARKREEQVRLELDRAKKGMEYYAVQRNYKGNRERLSQRSGS